MSQRPRDFSKEKVVFVEGKDEVNVIDSISKSLNLGDIESRDVGGKDKFPINFPLAVRQSSFGTVKTLAIIRDADDDEAAAFSSISALLRSNGLPAPQASGQFATDGTRRIGVLILPGSGRQGYLEDLFLDANAGTAWSRCVDAFAACCEAAGRMAFDSKDRAYGLLVALGAPENRLGRAFEQGKVNANHVAYDSIKAFLRQI